MKYTIEITRRKNGEYQVRIRARNGRIVLSGEGYKRKIDVMRMLTNLTTAITDNAVVVHYKP